MLLRDLRLSMINTRTHLANLFLSLKYWNRPEEHIFKINKSAVHNNNSIFMLRILVIFYMNNAKIVSTQLICKHISRISWFLFFLLVQPMQSFLLSKVIRPGSKIRSYYAVFSPASSFISGKVMFSQVSVILFKVGGEEDGLDGLTISPPLLPWLTRKADYAPSLRLTRWAEHAPSPPPADQMSWPCPFPSPGWPDELTMPPYPRQGDSNPLHPSDLMADHAPVRLLSLADQMGWPCPFLSPKTGWP